MRTLRNFLGMKMVPFLVSKSGPLEKPPPGCHLVPKMRPKVCQSLKFLFILEVRWTCENDGFVYTEPSFSWLEGIARDPRGIPKSTLAKILGKTLKSYKNHQNCPPKGAPRRAKGGPTNHLFRNFFGSGPFEVAWGA